MDPETAAVMLMHLAADPLRQQLDHGRLVGNQRAHLAGVRGDQRHSTRDRASAGGASARALSRGPQLTRST